MFGTHRIWRLSIRGSLQSYGGCSPDRFPCVSEAFSLAQEGCPAMKFSPMFPVARSRHSGNFFENFLENITEARG